MKTYFSKKEYIDIEKHKDEDVVSISIKFKIDEDKYMLSTVKVTKEQCDRILSSIVTAISNL